MIELGLFFLGLIVFFMLICIPIVGPIIIFQFSNMAGWIASGMQILVLLGAIINAFDRTFYK